MENLVGDFVKSRDNPQMASAVPYYEAMKLPFPDVVTGLVQLIGKKLTAYVASLTDADIIDGWQNGTPADPEAEARVRFAYRVAKGISQQYSPGVAQAWLQGVNPELDDRVAIQLIREEDLFRVSADILDAEDVFLAT